MGVGPIDHRILISFDRHFEYALAMLLRLSRYCIFPTHKYQGTGRHSLDWISDILPIGIC